MNNKDLSFKSEQNNYCIFSSCAMLTEAVSLKTCLFCSLCNSSLWDVKLLLWVEVIFDLAVILHGEAAGCVHGSCVLWLHLMSGGVRSPVSTQDLLVYLFLATLAVYIKMLLKIFLWCHKMYAN